MKKLLSAGLLVVALMLVSITAFAAQTGTCGTNVKWIFDGVETLTVSGNGAMKDSWGETNSPWNAYKEKINKVIIKEGITSVGNSLFNNYPNITSVQLPEGLTSIGNNAFQNCKSLSEINFPNTLTSIGTNAFYNCSALAKLEIPENVSNIGHWAFNSCTSVSEVIWRAKNASGFSTSVVPFGGLGKDTNGVKVSFEAGIEKIPNYVFCGNEYISELVLADTVTEIGQYAFYKCTNLTSVTFSEGLTTIGNSAFSYCGLIGELNFPTALNQIKEAAFAYCTGLTEVTLPPNLQYMANWAFASCGNIKRINWNSKNVADFSNESRPFPNAGNTADGITVVFGEGVIRIPAFAFYGTTQVKNILLSDTIESIGMYAFKETSVYKDDANWKNGCFYVGDVLIDTSSKLAWSHTVDSSTRIIAEHAFANRTSLTSVTVPSSVEKINEYAFYGCSGLKSISLPFTGFSRESNSGKKSVFGYIFGESAEEATVNQWHSEGETAFCIPSSLKTVTVTDMSEIFDGAFNNCKYITNIVIGDNTTKIGTNVFSDCSNLTGVSFGSGIAEIGDWAFYNCDSIVDIAVPEGITRIGAYAFYECNNLSQITLPDSVISIGYHAFDKTKFKHTDDALYIGSFLIKVKNTVSGEFKIAENTKYIADDALSGCSGLTDVKIPDSVTHIGAYAFSDCDGLVSVVIPDSVVSVGEFAFSDCDNLKSVTISKGGVTLRDFAFSKSGLEMVEIPENIQGIGSSVFNYCTKLKTVAIPESVADVSYRMFYGCSGLSDVKISNGTKSIGAYAFGENTELLDVTLPESLADIRTGAFEDCSSLKAVRYEGNSEDWLKIQIDIKNESLIRANIIYNYVIGDRVVYVSVDRQGEKFVVTPTGVKTGEEIICVCYNNDKMSYVKRFVYDGSPSVEFVPDKEYNQIRVFVFDSINTLIPLCKPNDVLLSR